LRSQPGSGAAPGVVLPTTVVRVRQTSRSAAALARALRLGDPPVFARVQEDALLLDPRTLLAGDEDRLLAAFARLA
jgi:L-seryl-tRNA(Ser) seleniumtransferase